MGVETGGHKTAVINRKDFLVVAPLDYLQKHYPDETELSLRGMESEERVLKLWRERPWISSAYQSAQFDGDDSTGTDIIVTNTADLAQLFGWAQVTVQVKSGPKGMDSHLRHNGRGRSTSPWAELAREHQILLNGQWPDHMMLGHLAVQLMGIHLASRYERFPLGLARGDILPEELMPFLSVLAQLDTELMCGYEQASVILGDQACDFYGMYLTPNQAALNQRAQRQDRQREAREEMQAQRQRPFQKKESDKRKQKDRKKIRPTTSRR